MLAVAPTGLLYLCRESNPVFKLRRLACCPVHYRDYNKVWGNIQESNLAQTVPNGRCYRYTNAP